MFKKHYILILFLFIGMAFGQRLELVRDFGDNPGRLRMYRYVPENIDLRKPIPMVLILHGSGQTANILAAASGFNKLADSLGFIAVYPDQPFYNNLLTAFSFYMPGKMIKDQGETASIKNMIIHMRQQYPIDGDRIFITGMSAGAAMSNVMLNAYPDIFAAGALFAAPSMLYEGVNPDRSHKPRIAIIHGDVDMTVNKKHADKIIDQWLEYFGLNKTDQRSNDPYLDDKQLAFTSWPAEGPSQLVRLNLNKTGHILLVDLGQDIDQGGQYSLFTQDKDFHLPYWICDFFELTNSDGP